MIRNTGSVGVDALAEKRLIRMDGAIAYLHESMAVRFDVAIEGSRGIMTTFKGVSQKSLTRLGKNNG